MGGTVEKAEVGEHAGAHADVEYARSSPLHRDKLVDGRLDCSRVLHIAVCVVEHCTGHVCTRTRVVAAKGWMGAMEGR